MQRARGIRTLIRAEVQGATPTALMQKAGDRWSARDVLIHLGNWEAEAVTWFGCLLNSEPIPQSSKPIDEWNAEHMAAYAELDAAGAVAYIEGTRQELEQVVTRITEEHLAGNPSFLGLLLMTPDHEIGHLHQLREALALARGDRQAAARHYLAYSRQRVLTRLNLEYRSPASLEWKPAPAVWSIKEMLIHLAAADRFWAGRFAALADSQPLPAPPWAEVELDDWNQATVAAGSYQTLAEVLHELGGARGALEAQLQRLSAEQVSSSEAQEWLKAIREHDDHHMHKLLDRLHAWRAAGN
jgi:uncharacterized damage-inducible protein DinB